MSGVCLICLLIALPETARNVVGNGSIIPPDINRSLLVCLKTRGKKTGVDRKAGSRFRLPSLIPCFKIIFHRHNALIMLINGIFYMTYCCIQASLSTLFINLYGFRSLEAGLIYLPFGFGCFISSYCSGIAYFFK
jgi:hypothetical protein